MTRPVVVRLSALFVLVIAVAVSGCSSVAGTSPVDTTASPATIGSSTPTPPSDPTAQLFELHYLRSTIAGRQAEFTASVRGDGAVRVTDELNGGRTELTLTAAELTRLRALLPVLADAPEPTAVVSDVGRIDARFPFGGREISVSVDDWSSAGGTARLPADEREVADAMIELRDLLIRTPSGSTAPSSSAPSTG